MVHLSLGRLGDRGTVSVEAGLVSAVRNDLRVAFGVGVTVLAANDKDGLRLVFFINSLLQLSVLVAGDPILGFKAVKKDISV